MCYASIVGRKTEQLGKTGPIKCRRLQNGDDVRKHGERGQTVDITSKNGELASEEWPANLISDVKSSDTTLFSPSFAIPL